MITHYRNTDDPSGPGKEKKNAKKQTGAMSDESCRCKEASDMTPRQLLGLMISDLAFWKNLKKK